jgi:hypothetical protein
MRLLPRLALVGVCVTACGGPLLIFPGGRLSGEEVAEPVEDWSFVTDGLIDLETQPDDPYSVQVSYTVKDGKLYIDPAEGRRWLEYLRGDPSVRVRLSGKVYPLTAVLIDQPEELQGFDGDRFVYRLDPRKE